MMQRKPVTIVLGAVLAALTVGAILALTGKGPTVPAAVAAEKPSPEEVTSFSHVRVFFGHQSVGSNVISGIQANFSQAANRDLAVVESRGEIPLTGGVLAHAHLGTNGDPRSKFEDFEAVLDGQLGDNVDVAALKLCYADVTAGTDVKKVFDEYVAMMARLEAGHPQVRFIYTTVPLSTDQSWKQVVKSWIGRDDQMGPADNLAREQYNQLVRQHYGETGRLFDIAAIESTMSTAPMVRTLDGAEYFVLHAGLAADPGHLNEVGSRVAGTEFMRVVVGAEN